MRLLDRSLIRLYQLCLVAYPRDFRSAYGAEMIQVFRTAMRDSSRARLALFSIAVVDLAGSAARERLAAIRWDARYLVVWAAAILISFSSGYLHLHTDADGMGAGLVLGGAFLCGLVYPRKPLHWGTIVGIGIPLGLLIAHRIAGVPVASHDADNLSPLTLVPALVGAYAGSFLGALMWRGPMTTEGYPPAP